RSRVGGSDQRRAHTASASAARRSRRRRADVRSDAGVPTATFGSRRGEDHPPAADRSPSGRPYSPRDVPSPPVTRGWNFADAYEVIAEQVPDAPSQVQGNHRITWREFDRRADGVAKM